MRIILSMIAVVLLVAGCRSADVPPTPQPPTVSAASLVGTSWVAEDIDGRGVIDRVPSTLTFESPQRISGRAACNRYFGSVEQVEGRFRLRPAGTTRMACAPAVMDQEARFLGALAAAATFHSEAGKLLLMDEGGRVRVRLEPAVGDSGASAPVPLQAHAFDCSEGPSFVLVRVEGAAGPGEAIDLVLPGGRRRLPRVPTASGERYTDTGVSVWSKGREATLELDGRIATCVEDRRRSILEDARSRAVEFRASGNEPGWIFELLPDRMAFVGGYGEERVATPRPAPSAGPGPGETVYAAVTAAHRLTVRIRDASCLDSMSGDRYEATVEVELDGRTHRGCGQRLQ